MKKIILFFSIILFCFSLSGNVYANLLQIGTATYNSLDYKLIYDDVNQITWLDYSYDTNNTDAYGEALTWINDLNISGTLSYSFLSGYSDISWGAEEWRLPKGKPSGRIDQIIDDYSTELGYLYYIDLSNDYQEPLSTLNFGPFANLHTGDYWSDYAATWAGVDYAQALFMHYELTTGLQYMLTQNTNGGTYAMAVISGDVTASSENHSPVPEPATMLLLGSGLIGFVGFRKKIKK